MPRVTGKVRSAPKGERQTGWFLKCTPEEHALVKWYARKLLGRPMAGLLWSMGPDYVLARARALKAQNVEARGEIAKTKLLTDELERAARWREGLAS